MSISVTEKIINPVDAKYILDNHKNYRNISMARVRTYADDMVNGRWKRSELKFNKDGDLVDGQHRLEAVIKSNSSQLFVCSFGWTQDEVITMDNGQNRSKGQVAQYEYGITSANRKMAIATGIVSIGDSRMLSNAATIEAYYKYQDVIEDTHKLLPKSGPLKAALYCVTIARGIIKYPYRRNELLESFEKTVDLDFYDDRMSGLKMFYQFASSLSLQLNSGKFRRYDIYLKHARATEAYLNGEVLTKLYKPSNDPFKIN